MKKFIFSLMVALLLTSCVAYAEPEPIVVNNCVEYCDDYGCREVCAPHYYYQGVVYYWDTHFSCWIGPHGYYHGGIFYHGYYPGYRGYFGHGGGFHGHGGGHFGGGHGGHR
jgi:hypothetical protein